MTARWRSSCWARRILVGALIALGDVLFFRLGLHGGTFGLYGLALLLALAIARPAVTFQPRARLALILAALYALAMAISASPLAWMLFWTAAGMATLLPRTAAFDNGWRWFQRLFYHGLVSVAGPIPDLVRRARVRAQRRRSGPSLRTALPMLILPVLGTAAFIALFSAANPVIDAWLTSLSLPGMDESMIGRMILWAVLVWLAWGLLRPHMARSLLGTFDGAGDAAIPGVSPASVLISLIAFNALFLIQNAMDAAWLWGLVPLPEGMTLAAYAHRGAYPLVVTALLAALFVLVALRPGSRMAENPLIRRLVMAWTAQNLFLVLNAALRTLDYVEAYSLTILRIAALLWMALVALGLVLVLWRMLAGKSTGWLINANCAALGLLLTIIAFTDLGAIAARWNVAHAREIDGDGAALDLCYLNSLNGSALLPLIELEARPLAPAFHQRLRNVRLMVHFRLADDVSWGAWDWLSQSRLDRARDLIGPDIGPRPDRAFDCDGTPIPVPAPESAPAPSLPAPSLPAPSLTAGAVR